MSEKEILKLLESITHPETGRGLTIKNLSVSPHSIRFTIVLERSRDPLAGSLKKEAIRVLAHHIPQSEGKVTVFFEEPAAAAPERKTELPPPGGIEGIKRVIAVSSCKGGVGKSTVTANLALTMASMGYKVGILDADIYGPSQPALFGVEGYVPGMERIDDKELMNPAAAEGIEIMSIGFFIDPKDALVWRGPMATSALKQLIRQTNWGALDYLLIDLPPGTGDVHLTVLQELHVDGAIIVTTPQKIALADVLRGITMFRSEKINIPILGVVENMAWFTPAELPASRYYLFGRGGGRELAAEQGLPFLGEIPLVLPRDTSPDGTGVQNVGNSELKSFYLLMAKDIASNVKC